MIQRFPRMLISPGSLEKIFTRATSILEIFYAQINKFCRAIHQRGRVRYFPLSLSLSNPPLPSFFLSLLPAFPSLSHCDSAYSSRLLSFAVAQDGGGIGEVIQEVGYNFNDGVSARADY